MKNTALRRRLRRGPCLAAILLLTFAACSRDPNVIKRKYFESGNRYFDKGQYRAALIQYQNAIRIDKSYTDAHYHLGLCYLKLGIWNGAYQELSRAVEANPDDLKAQVTLGNLMLAAREFNRAREIAELVLKRDPKNVDGHVLLANSYAGLNNVEASLEQMQDAIQLAPERPGTYLRLGYLQQYAQTAQAEKSFKKAVELDPKSAGALLALGNFYMQQRRWPEAEQQIQRAITVQPQNVIPRAALARLYLAEEQKQKAEAALTQAKKDMPNDPNAYRILGDFYFAVGDLDKAVAEYGSVYQGHPKDLITKKNYVQLLILDNRLDEAAKLNGEILAKNQKDEQGLIFRGEVFGRQGRTADAIQSLQTASTSEPDNPVPHYYLGVAFAQNGDWTRAESEWREAAQLRPEMVEAERALVAIAMRKGDLDLLNQSAEALINAQPSSPEGYIDRATVRIDRGYQSEGEADLQKAIQLAPQNPMPYARIAALRVAQKRYGEAEQLFEQSLEHDPNFAEALNGLVGIYMDQQQAGKALAVVQAQIAKAPNNAGYYVTLTKIYAVQKDWEKAEIAAQKAVDLSPSGVEALQLLGQIQAARGSLDKAAASYQRAIQQNARNAESYVLLGQLESSRGQWQKAQELYQRALGAQPDYAPAANNLAFLMLEHGQNPDVALTLAQTARRGMPNSATAADTLGWAYYYKGAYQSAINLLQQALTKLPQDPEIHYHLGMAYEKSGDRARAKVELQRTLQLDPNYVHSGDVRQALAELARK